VLLQSLNNPPHKKKKKKKKKNKNGNGLPTPHFPDLDSSPNNEYVVEGIKTQGYHRNSNHNTGTATGIMKEFQRCFQK